MFNKLKGKLNKNKKNIAKISTGTLIGQLISVITLPIITRIYGPTVIGVWTLLYSIATLIKSFSDLGMTNSLMTEDEEFIESTYKVTTTIVAIISLISAFVVTFCYANFVNAIKINLVFLFVLTSSIIFITQQIQVCYTWLNRKGEYDILMKNPLIKNGSYGIIAILLGIFGIKTYGYFIGYIIGLTITLFHMKRNLPRYFFTSDIQLMKNTLIRNKRFILFQMPTSFLANFKNQLPVLLIQRLWGSKLLGYYSITVKLLQIPSTLLAKAIGRVFFQTTAMLQREGKPLGAYVYKNIIKGMKVATLPMIFLMAFGDVIAIIFLGNGWEIAGDFVRILALQYFFMFLMNAVLGLAITIEKQHYAMLASIFQIIGFLTGGLLGKYLFENIYIGLGIMAILYAIIHIIYFSMMFKVMGIPPQDYITRVLGSVFIIIIGSLILRYAFDYLGIIKLLLMI